MKIIGIIGTVIAALCCFTPVLPAVLGGIGLSGLVPVLYRDSVLLPLLGVFLVLTLIGFWRSRRDQKNQPTEK